MERRPSLYPFISATDRHISFEFLPPPLRSSTTFLYFHIAKTGNGGDGHRSTRHDRWMEAVSLLRSPFLLKIFDLNLTSKVILKRGNARIDSIDLISLTRVGIICLERCVKKEKMRGKFIWYVCLLVCYLRIIMYFIYMCVLRVWCVYKYVCNVCQSFGKYLQRNSEEELYHWSLAPFRRNVNEFVEMCTQKNIDWKHFARTRRIFSNSRRVK